MKQIISSLFILFFLASCGLDSAAQDGLTNAVGLNSAGQTAVLVNNEILAANVLDFQCSGVFIPGRTYARVNYQLTTDNEALGGDTAVLHGAGLLTLGETQLDFSEEQPFTCRGSGQLRAYKTSEDGSAALVDWLLEQSYTSLTAQIDGVMTPLSDATVVGLAVWPGQEPAILTSNETVTELKAFQCQGTMIPGSSQASIIFTAETTAGEKFTGGGILEMGDSATGGSAGFDCTMEGEGEVTTLDAVELETSPPLVSGIMFETFISGSGDDAEALLNMTIPTLRVRSGSGQDQQIMFETFMTAIARAN